MFKVATGSAMPQISSKNDLVPDWTGMEVSTGVSKRLPAETGLSLSQFDECKGK